MPAATHSNWKLPFGILWTGQAISLFGSSLVQFALVWWLTQTTRSATVLAMATLVAVLPNVLLGPVAGVLVDRWNRRVIMIVADALVALATLVLALLFLVGAAQVWHVYVILFFRAVAGIFHSTAMQTSTSLMVPDRHLARVAGFNQALNGGMNIVAPPVGALLLGLLPLQGVLAIDIVTALLGISPLFFIKVPQPPRKAEAAEAGTPWPSLWSEMGAGLAYVWAWPGMMILLGMASLINFTLNPASALLPILVTKHFGGGVMDLASLESVFGLGIVIGGVALGVWGGFRRRIFTSLAALVGIGVGFVLLGLAPANAFWLAVASSFLAAFMLPMANGPLMAVMQAVVAPEMQGRVFTLIGSVATAMSPLGLLIAGPIADALGIQAWYLVGGVTCLLMGVLAFFIPAITRLEDRLASPSVVVSETEVVPG